MAETHPLSLGLFCLLVLVPVVFAGPLVYQGDYWLKGRATWFGNQEGSWLDPFSSQRPKTNWGTLEWGYCMLTNADGSLLVPKDQSAAIATANPDFPGSCGRCYEVKCAGGPVLGMNDKPLQAKPNFFMYWHFANVTDEQGRSFPGNAGEPQGLLDVQCWDKNKSIVVKIMDICPCYYMPKGQKPFHQPNCCYKELQHEASGQLAMDLSFWSFQQLAHPEYGVMMIQFRPVDCTTHKPIRFDPGYISDTIYDDFPGVGWSWLAGNSQGNQWSVVDKGKGVGGSAASCAALNPGGNMTWICTAYQGEPSCGDKEDYQPFAGAASVTFWVKDESSPGSAPPVSVQLIKGTCGESCYTNMYTLRSCNAQLDLSSRTPDTKTADGWMKYTIPIAEFRCSNPEQMNQLVWRVNEGAGATTMCLDDVAINREAAAPAAPAPAASG